MSFLRFAAVGVIGFVADTAILLAGAKGLHFPPVPARVVSFICAASLTYWLNGQFTFRRTSASLGRWLVYLMTTAVGATINIAVFREWVSYAGAGWVQLIVGAAFGSLSGLFFNYLASSTFAFPNTGARKRDRTGAHAEE